MPITNGILWKEYTDKNKDPYGRCCVQVAKEAMRMLDENKDDPIIKDYDKFST